MQTKPEANITVRYAIHVIDGETVSVGRGDIGSSDSHGRQYQATLRDCIAETDNAHEARRIAEEHAPAYPYGTAILDRQDGTVDCGDSIIPVKDVYVPQG